MLYDVSFHESNEKCDDVNENAKFNNELDATSTFSFVTHVPQIVAMLFPMAMLQIHL